MVKEGAGLDKYYYQWQTFDKDIEKAAEWARGKGFTSIYGVPRGGLVPAVALSHWVGLPLKLDSAAIDERTLIVDDISDSGKTLCELENKLSFKPVVATLFYFKDTARKPDYWIREKTKWIVFPWETDVSSMYDNTLESLV